MIQWITSSQCRPDGVQKGAEERRRKRGNSFIAMLSGDGVFSRPKGSSELIREKENRGPGATHEASQSYLNTSGEAVTCGATCLQRLQCPSGRPPKLAENWLQNWQDPLTRGSSAGCILDVSSYAMLSGGRRCLFLNACNARSCVIHAATARHGGPTCRIRLFDTGLLAYGVMKCHTCCLGVCTLL